MSAARVPKPAHLQPEYGAQFSDPSVAAAYRFRPPYPEEVDAILEDLIVDVPRVVLDLGCGPGDIARRLAPRVERVDAVDPSRAMLDIGRALPGGASQNVRWFHCTAEEFPYPPGYALVVAAQSLHWMDWDRVLPAIGGSLAPRGRLAIVLGCPPDAAPWWSALRSLAPLYSTTPGYAPYDLVEELTTRSLFRLDGRVTTRPVPFSQPVEDYIESWHARNGFSRDRMLPSSAAELDARIREIVTPFAVSGRLGFEVKVEVAWGVPA